MSSPGGVVNASPGGVVNASPVGVSTRLDSPSPASEPRIGDRSESATRSRLLTNITPSDSPGHSASCIALSSDSIVSSSPSVGLE